MKYQSRATGSSAKVKTNSKRSPRGDGGGEVMTESGARYAITVDGVVRTHRASREAGFEAANVLKALRPCTKIVIHDLQTAAEIDPQQPWTTAPEAEPKLPKLRVSI